MGAEKDLNSRRCAEKEEEMTDLSETKPEDHYKFFKMLDDFIFQIKDDVLRESLEYAAKIERLRYDQRI